MTKRVTGMTNRTKSGFTIIEVLISIAILAMLGIFTALFFSSNRKEVQMSNQDLLINIASTEILDQILSLPISAFKVGNYSENELVKGKLLKNSQFKMYLSTIPGVNRSIKLKKVKIGSNEENLLIDLTTSAISPLNKKSKRIKKFCLVSSYGSFRKKH